MNKLLIPGLLLAAVGLYSCDDKDFDNGGPGGGIPLEPGTEVTFGAGLEAGQAQSRTVYGDEKDNLFPIYWTFSEDESLLDRILIHSPQAESKRAEYKVKPTGDGRETPQGYAAVSKVHEESAGVVLGEGAHNFYGFYPWSQLIESENSDGSGNYICGLMPAVQIVKCGAPVKNGQSETYTYIAEHNMDYCFMLAEHIGVTPTANRPVQLQFKPWSTVLDITLPGPKADDAEGSYTITDIIVRSMPQGNSDAPCIVGTFRYDFPTKDGESGKISFPVIGNNATTEPDHILTVNVCNSDGSKGVVLKTGESLNLKAFMLPVSDVTGIRVEVYASGNKMWDLDLVKPAGRDNLLTPGSIHKIGLPSVGGTAKEDYSSWMTDMSDDILVTELSIPGSYESFSYAAANASDRMQSIDISAQFEAGIRAFRARVVVKDGDDNRLRQGWSQHLAVTMDGNTEIMPLGEAIHILHQEMQSRGNQEVCVLMLNQSDIVENLTADEFNQETRKNRDYYKAMKNYALYMAQHGITPANVTNDLRLSNYRGKVILQGLLNANVPTSYCEYWSAANNATITPMYNIQRWLNAGAGNKDAMGTLRDKPADSDIGPKSWAEADGAPMLLSWTVKISTTETRLTPVTFGRVGTTGTSLLTYSPLTSELQDVNTKGWVRPTTTDPLPGLAYMASNVIFDGTTYHQNTQANTTTLKQAYKSNMHFDYTKLTGQNANYPGTNVYKEWINGPEDERYLWWVRTDVPWNTNSSSDVYKVVAALWGNKGSSKAVELYGLFGSRLFFTTDIATPAAVVPDGMNGWGVANCTEGVNYFFFMNYLNNLVSKSQRNENNTFTNGLTINDYPRENLDEVFNSVPLGVVFMYQVPDRDENVTPKTTDKLTHDAPSFLKAHKWHVKQTIKLLVEHSQKFSAEK